MSALHRDWPDWNLVRAAGWRWDRNARRWRGPQGELAYALSQVLRYMKGGVPLPGCREPSRNERNTRGTILAAIVAMRDRAQ